MSETLQIELCKNLRTKKMYYQVYDDGTGTAGTGTNANYWCTRTKTVIGPDDGFVGKQECIRGRDCFVSIDD
jgi:hypothetical protein